MLHLLQEAQPAWSPDVSWFGIQLLPRPRSKVEPSFQVDKHDLQKRESICSKALEIRSVILPQTLSRGLMQSPYFHGRFQHQWTCWIMRAGGGDTSAELAAEPPLALVPTRSL